MLKSHIIGSPNKKKKKDTAVIENISEKEIHAPKALTNHKVMRMRKEILRLYFHPAEHSDVQKCPGFF